MLNTLTSLFKELLEGKDLAKHSQENTNLAIAALLCEVSQADYSVGEKEYQAKLMLIQRLIDVGEDEATTLLTQAQQKVKESASLYDFTSSLRDLSRETRFELIKGMWQVAHADGDIDPLEDAVIRKVAELLYVDHSDFIRAKLQVTKR